jgi:hypothetical protein
MYMQRTTSGAAGNGLYTTIKFMRGAAGIGLDTTIKYLRRTTSPAANNGLGTTIKFERGWPSYFIVVRREKVVGVRGVQTCVRKLAANASDCATSECLVFSIVTRGEGFKVG